MNKPTDAPEEKLITSDSPEEINHEDTSDSPEEINHEDEDRHVNHESYLKYALQDAPTVDDASLATATAWNPAPLPLRLNEPLGRHPRGPGAYRHAGVDHQGSDEDEFASLQFGEDDVPPLPNQENEEGLARAFPVTLPTETAEPMPFDLTIPENQEEKGEQAKKQVDLHLWIPFGLCVLLFVVVGISIAAASASSDTPQAHNINDSITSKPPKEWEWDLPFDVPNSTLSILISDPNGVTPQHKAYKWMKGDPLLYNYSNERLCQRFAMAAFYYATNGPNWTFQGGEEIIPITIQLRSSEESRHVINITDSKPWLSYEHSECDWLSMAEPQNGLSACNNTNDTLGHLVLIQNNLQGSLIDEMGDLMNSLCAIDLQRNAIGGTIPTNVGHLSNLHRLDFWRNPIEGSIPTQLGLLTELTWLQFLECQLTGNLPSQLWQLSNLEDLKISDNKDLAGSLPSDLGSAMPNLKLLQSARNQLSGSVPPSMGTLSQLERIVLHDNQLTGQLPSQLGLVVTEKLTKFFAPYNLFSGTLPAEWSQSMGFVDLKGNAGITGTIPVEWATMSLVKLEGTSIFGTIPEEVCGVKRLSFDCSPTLCGCSCPCPNVSDLV